MSKEVWVVGLANGDKLNVASKHNLKNEAGKHDDIVRTHVPFSFTPSLESEPPLPSSGEYSVQVTPDHPCCVYVQNKTPRGFDVVMEPMYGKKIHEGAFDVMVTWKSA